MRPTLCIAVLVILAAVPPALAGPVTPVSCDAETALQARPMYVMGLKVTKGVPGLVHSQAVVGTLRGNGWSCSVAIDAAKADAKAPDVLRLDFSGKGDFTKAVTLPLKPTTTGPKPTGYFDATVGQGEINATINGQTVPAQVAGQYIKSGNFRRLQIMLGTGVEGKVAFGGKEMTVRIVDGDRDLKAGKAWQKRKLGRNVAVVPGDTVAVDVGGGKTRKACYGSPIEIGGAWYDVKLSADGKAIAASPVAVTGGKLSVKHPMWKTMLIGEKYVLPMEGGAEPVSVPAGQYDLRGYEEFSAPDAQDRRAQLMVTVRPGLSTSKVTVEAGKTTELAIGSPLKGSIAASKSGRNVRLSLRLTDAAGRPVAALVTAKGKRPPAPTVIIKDESGKQVYKNTLEYG